VNNATKGNAGGGKKKGRSTGACAHLRPRTAAERIGLLAYLVASCNEKYAWLAGIGTQEPPVISSFKIPEFASPFKSTAKSVYNAERGDI
jgi:hypothetical protein